MWTKESLQKFIKDKMSDYCFIVVSNRQPFVHVFDKKGEITYQRGAGGLITAINPVMETSQGTWVGFGNGEADKKVTDKDGRIMVPPDNPIYTLKRVWLTKSEEGGYYYGYSNQALWPLCHMAFQQPIFRQEDWDYYCKVNEKFARAIIDEIGNKKAVVWIQDYHLSLLAKYLRNMAKSPLIITQFWHIPWPNYEMFRICPQRHEIIDGLLSNDILGFHIRYHCDNFFDVVDREIQSKIDRERFSVTRDQHETLIRPYPISVDYEGISSTAKKSQVKRLMNKLKKEFKLSGYKVILGLDRIDYIKGIPERLKALDRMIEKYPKLKKQFVFIQFGEISRIHIPRYKSLNNEILTMVDEINWKYSIDDWTPIIMVRRHLPFEESLAFYRMGDVCIVSSIHDGMNLVAKEFVSSRYDRDGVLVLSQFTGAARELEDAILVNPYDTEQFSEDIYTAITMDIKERKRRMKKMRQVVKQNNIYRWAGRILSDLLKFDYHE